MAPGESVDGSARRTRDRVLVAVVAVTVLALVVRLLALGDRIAHWDEARVAWWVLDFMRTGNFRYQPIIHGPFYHHVNALVFSVFGSTDFTMRLVVALAGGLLPLSVLLVRNRLSGTETVALAIFLAVDPILLYYSRFMRGDLLVGAFMFVAFLVLVRTVDTGDQWGLFAAAALVALGFTVKENALVYLVTWVGATALLLDHRLFGAGENGSTWPDVLARYVAWAGRGIVTRLPAIALAVVEFFVILVYFYAPRGDATRHGEELTTMGDVASDPTLLPALVDEAILASGDALYGQWIAKRAAEDSANPYFPYLGDLAATVGYGSVALCALAIVGFLVDRYTDGGPRDLVSFCFYWGFVSLLGYPLATDIKAPWSAVHVVLPLAVPAAVGLALIVRWGREALADDDIAGVAVAVFLVVVLAGQVTVVAVDSSYVDPVSDDNELVQYAQPSGDIRPELRTMGSIDRENGNETDVLFVGDYFVDGHQTARRTPACLKWFNALPLPWYIERDDIDIECAETVDEFDREYAGDAPPMVITRGSQRENVSARLDGYDSRSHLLRTFDTETVFFVDRSRSPALDEPARRRQANRRDPDAG